ncbi:BrnA antitoxin family protein [Labrys monachus]|uniref:Uncharacterized protein (DUF4415 family) n=1 Tax=Labrys monachus TaxID=217067 RepID=A0ABU0FM80_9HYPH|nr:BrnA antitoxin family protein [Labrys monachus]MDQ0395708.1 uncharacterized protein (DUF4415 family) [Labrys monachus]
MSPRPFVTDPDNPEWTEEDFANARPAHEMPDDMKAVFKNAGGRPKKEDPKRPVSIRLSPEVVDYFKSGGPGWQTRIDDTLRKAIGIGSTPRKIAAGGKTPSPVAARQGRK